MVGGVDHFLVVHYYFRIGAAIRAEDGTIFIGTNIENASYSLTICAERVAIFNAVSKGHRSFTDLAIATSSGLPTPPCGSCRHVLHEFNPEMRIHLEGDEKEEFRLKDLLPYAFAAWDSNVIAIINDVTVIAKVRNRPILFLSKFTLCLGSVSFIFKERTTLVFICIATPS
jgi:cytidine deaminase